MDIILLVFYTYVPVSLLYRYRSSDQKGACKGSNKLASTTTPVMDDISINIDADPRRQLPSFGVAC